MSINSNKIEKRNLSVGLMKDKLKSKVKSKIPSILQRGRARSGNVKVVKLGEE